MQSLVAYSRSAARTLVSNAINECNGSAAAAGSASIASGILNSRLVNCLFTNLRLLSQSFSLRNIQASPSLSFISTSPLSLSTFSYYSSSSSSSSPSALQQHNNNATATSLVTSRRASSTLTTAAASSARSLSTLHLVTAYSGFSKDLTSPLCKKGVIGDDAWFIASQKSMDVLGVADGVGGWREVGVDPSKFSSNLMRTCKRIVEQEPDLFGGESGAEVNRKTPMEILSQSYNALLENKNSLIGSSTACIIVFHRESSLLHSANLGDSGFVIIRNNKIVHRSQEQRHYFNSPFQMAILPSLPGAANLFNDSPESASVSSFELAEGDFIVVATDGLWDNFPEPALVEEIAKIKVSEPSSTRTVNDAF